MSADFQSFDVESLTYQKYDHHPEHAAAFECPLHCTCPFSGLRLDRVTINAPSAQNLQALGVCGIPLNHLLSCIDIEQHASRPFGNFTHPLFGFPRSEPKSEHIAQRC